MRRKIFILFLVLNFLGSQGILYGAQIPASAAENLSSASSVATLSLDSLIEEARKNNPDILANQKQYEAAQARIPQAKSLDNPTIGLTFGKTRGSPFQLSKTMPEDRMLSLQQAIPFFGKLPLKGKIALVESQMAASELKNKELEIINQVKNAYFDLFLNNQEIELNSLSLEFLKGISKIAETKYSTGALPQEEVQKINLEIAKADSDILNLEQENEAKQTRLNTLLNRDPESPLGAPVISEEISFNPDTRTLYQAALLNQPELIIFSYAIEKNKYAKALAKKSVWPDILAGITMRGISSGSMGPWDLMLALSVPLWFWSKQRYEIKEAIFNLEQAQVAYKSMENKAFSEVKDLVAKIEISKNQADLYENNLIPIIQSSIESSLAAFRVRKGDMMALLDSQRMLIETKMKYYKALVDYNINLSDLERTVGADLKEVRK